MLLGLVARTHHFAGNEGVRVPTLKRPLRRNSEVTTTNRELMKPPMEMALCAKPEPLGLSAKAVKRKRGSLRAR